MIVSINQPAYLPWMGYFDRIRRSDLHIVLDTVQFEKGSFVNRNQIVTRRNGSCWLTLPVRRAPTIAEMTIAEGAERIVEKNCWTLEQNLDHPVLDELVRAMLTARSGDPMVRHLLHVSSVICEELKIVTPIEYASDFEPTGTKSDLVLDICKKAGATTYLSGPYGRSYLDLGAFADAGIAVEFHEANPAWVGKSAVQTIAEVAR